MEQNKEILRIFTEERDVAVYQIPIRGSENTRGSIKLKENLTIRKKFISGNSAVNFENPEIFFINTAAIENSAKFPLSSPINDNSLNASSPSIFSTNRDLISGMSNL